jgi:starvation-inducible DNA-binding protein
VEDLIQSLKVTLANTFAFYLKAHYYHWNVEGVDFHQYHTLLNQIYEEVYDSVDPMAEFIRILNAYAPGSLSRFTELSEIPGDDSVPAAPQMFANLLMDTETILASIEKSRKLAEDNGEFGLANFLQDRDAAHKKHRWMMRSLLKQ